MVRHHLGAEPWIFCQLLPHSAQWRAMVSIFNLLSLVTHIFAEIEDFFELFRNLLSYFFVRTAFCLVIRELSSPASGWNKTDPNHDNGCFIIIDRVGIIIIIIWSSSSSQSPSSSHHHHLRLNHKLSRLYCGKRRGGADENIMTSPLSPDHRSHHHHHHPRYHRHHHRWDYDVVIIIIIIIIIIVVNSRTSSPLFPESFITCSHKTVQRN